MPTPMPGFWLTVAGTVSYFLDGIDPFSSFAYYPTKAPEPSREESVTKTLKQHPVASVYPIQLR